ncbi:MAG: cytochrome c-type biogenesis protein CcmH [Motiliproteus sp.]|nr:cytochrome c-type biogenesis protein CcmH [Motiliproteus sp.]MCW9051732.1 cytochrome c-type biogenesis protein CcmH [Motiliproteus sp.]
MFRKPWQFICGCMFGMLLSAVSHAAIDTYLFTDDENRGQFKLLTEELRCPKCQNQNLSDSNSPIASDMRREIHRMVEEGQSNQQVVDFMVARYGDFVRYRPKRDSTTALLWYGPIALLAFGALVVFVVAKKRKTKEHKPEQGLADNEQERLKRLLGDKDKGDQ